VIRPQGSDAYFLVERGVIRQTAMQTPPAAFPDRLFLVAASGSPDFREVFDALSGIEVYNLNPSRIAALQSPDPGDVLQRDGGNAASVFKRFPEVARKLVSTRLSHVVPQVSDIEYKIIGPMETLEFRQAVEGRNDHWRFFSSSMSDGTLRAFGALLAIYQGRAHPGTASHPLVIGLEEPETALHPAAAQVLLAALREGSQFCQILVTSHSPDLLDNEDIPVNSILAVESDEGKTRIGPVDEASRQALADRLFTAGELLRQGQLLPDDQVVSDVKRDRQLSLFDADR
jgi:predicted ATPase